MKIIRKKTLLKRMSKKEDCFVDASPQRLLSFMWELTAELWSLQGSKNVKRRLQRNVTNLIKNKKSTGREKDKLDIKYLKENKNI